MKIYTICKTGYEYCCDNAHNEEAAIGKIKYLMKMDRHEIETEKYPMPEVWGGEYPKYYYVKRGKRYDVN